MHELEQVSLLFIAPPDPISGRHVHALVNMNIIAPPRPVSSVAHV